jgi:glycosyltransferase involved in cell wall biosynthesis
VLDLSRLLAVSERVWPDPGGGSLAAHLIVKLVCRSKPVSVTVLTGTQQPARVGGAKYFVVPLLGARNRAALWKNISVMARQRWFLKLLISSDILYVPGYCYPLIGLAKRLGKKVIVHLHGYEPISYASVVLPNDHGRGIPRATQFEILERHGALKAIAGGFFEPVSRLIRIWLSKADEVVCVSKRQAQIIAEEAPELARKMRVLYSPIPEVHFAKSLSGERLMLYLGGDSYVKGFHAFLGASQEIIRRDRGVRFLLLGSMKNSTNTYLRKLNERSNHMYNVLGHVGHDEALQLNSRSCALLFPSICEEAFGYAVLEAMLTGTIPVASRVGAVPEIVHSSYAERTMFTPGKVKEMVDRIEALLHLSDEQLLDIGTGLRESALRKFDTDRIKDEWVDLLR